MENFTESLTCAGQILFQEDREIKIIYRVDKRKLRWE